MVRAWKAMGLAAAGERCARSWKGNQEMAAGQQKGDDLVPVPGEVCMAQPKRSTKPGRLLMNDAICLRPGHREVPGQRRKAR